MKKEPLPEQMRTKQVEVWSNCLERQKGHLVCKRVFDIVISLLILLITCPFFLLLALAIKI
ncbi:MAG TPA: sugar transferase, partial [Candidatus Gallacutalibacter pullistercoris]|nr:sugar transferase [Candidatus Gallacutalibacter pullistercoris]